MIDELKTSYFISHTSSFMLQQLFFLLQKEWTLEWRQKYAIGGILLYVVSTVFIVFLSFRTIQPMVWNVLFWIIALFAAINAVVKSFVQESGSRQLYYYTLADPTILLLSKIIYNTVLLFVLMLLTYACLSFIAGNPVVDNGLFLLALLLGAVGFSVAFTFISAISAKASNGATLMAILSFPVVLPILLILIKLSAQALRLLQDTSIQKDVFILVGIDAILIALGFVLFPYLWRD
jgi:heme exporter protein B